MSVMAAALPTMGLRYFLGLPLHNEFQPSDAANSPARLATSTTAPDDLAGGMVVTFFTTRVVYLYLDRFRLWLRALRGRPLPLGTPDAPAGSRRVKHAAVQ